MLVVVGLLVASLVTARGIASLGAPDAVAVELVGHQWRWEVRYPGGGAPAITANELHLPVGRPVQVLLASEDVIHSLWIPHLHGKRDLIPSHPTTFWLQADRASEFRGQCAEFCGLQHAWMALRTVAEPADRFEAWLARERTPAAEPADEPARRGLEVFLGAPCVGCHTIRGTPTAGRLGPDLTHVASRRWLAAGE